ncbi:YoaK family protein [Streptomyces sp. NPDC001970]
MNRRNDESTGGRPVDTPAEPGAAVLPEKQVVRLLAVLTAAAGSLDAVCVAGLDGVFASVITGNLVQLGRALVALDGRLAAGATVAVGCYALGVAAATAGLGRRGAGWYRRTSLIVTAELALLAGVAGGWPATDGHPGADATMLLLAAAGAAMGVQSAVTNSSGVRGASTTYLTGTLTGLARALGGEPHRFAAAAAARLAAFLCGATAGALLLRFAPLWAPVLPMVLVAAVVVTATAFIRERVEERG